MMAESVRQLKGKLNPQLLREEPSVISITLRIGSVKKAAVLLLCMSRAYLVILILMLEDVAG